MSFSLYLNQFDLNEIQKNFRFLLVVVLSGVRLFCIKCSLVACNQACTVIMHQLVQYLPQLMVRLGRFLLRVGSVVRNLLLNTLFSVGFHRYKVTD